MGYKEDCPQEFYYAIGIVGGEFEHHLWQSEGEAKKFYKKPNTFIKGWSIESINGERFIKGWDKAKSLCEEILQKVKKEKLSIEELSSKLPDEL